MLSKNLEKTLHKAFAIAKHFHHEYTTLEHLLLALSEDDDAMQVMHECSVNIKNLQESLKNFLIHDLEALVVKEAQETRPTAGFQRVIHRAAVQAHSSGNKEVDGANVLSEIFSERESHAVYFLHKENLTCFDVINHISNNILEGAEEESDDDFPADIPPASMPRVETRPVPHFDEHDGPFEEQERSKEIYEPLDTYCENLNKSAVEGKTDVLIGRKEEIDRIIQVLSRRTKNNPLLVGDPGVGKTALAQGLAHRIVKGKVPAALKKTEIFSLDVGALVAGTRFRGDLEERIKSIANALKSLPHAVLFIDEMHTLIGAGSTSGGSLDMGNLLKPALTDGSMRCIGSTTYKEFRNYMEKDKALLRRFQKIDVAEPSTDEAVKILKGLKEYYEEHHNVEFTKEALKAAVELSQRYIHDRKLPDKAIDIIDEAGAYQGLLPAKERAKEITAKEIEETIAHVAQIPVGSVSSDEMTKIGELATNLEAKIFGQNEAIEALESAIKLSKAKLRKPHKPMGCYLFSGPTGVGKTELALQLSKELSMNLIRIDMSEYSEQYSLSRLIGSPPGYVGHEQGGLLTDQVDQFPYSVVLLDEIEKAHTDIYNTLLQVMDYGSLTDNNGKTVNFRHVILIMTTNAGAEDLSRTPIGFGDRNNLDDVNDEEAIKRVFAPEFRNRLDSVIQFKALTPELMEKIVDKFILEVGEQLADHGVKIEIGAQTRTHLAKQGYDAAYGARPLERLIESEVKKPLADEILFGKLKGGGKVKVTLKKDGTLSFNIQQKRSRETVETES